MKHQQRLNFMKNQKKLSQRTFRYVARALGMLVMVTGFTQVDIAETIQFWEQFRFTESPNTSQVVTIVTPPIQVSAPVTETTEPEETTFAITESTGESALRAPAVSAVDTQVTAEHQKQLSETTSEDVTTNSETQVAQNPVTEAWLNLLKSAGWEVQSTARNDQDQVEVVLSSDRFFTAGTADWNPSQETRFQQLLTDWKQAVSNQIDQYQIEVEAYTDDTPIVKQKNRYRTNWDLSAARAASFVRFFEAIGISKERLKAVGYGASRPLLPNRSEDGKVIPENVQRNRRIVLRMSEASN